VTEETGAALRRGAYLGRAAERERLGRIVCGCELRESPATGGRRHHHFAAVLRDLAGNVWACEHRHTEQDDAHACARAEFERRAPALAKGAKAGRPV
jgi:hypothetical protein